LRSATGKRLIIAWDGGGKVCALVDDILRLPPRHIGDASLFVTRQGKPDGSEDGSANAVDSFWKRFIRKPLNETALTECFQEGDLWAKVASESASREEASERLAHASTDITKREYRRKSVTVKPLILDITRANKK
jgi:hypothetical protein